MNKRGSQMNILGIGPLLAMVGGCSFIILFLLQHVWGIAIPFPSMWREYFLTLGILLTAIGIYFWISSALLISRAFRSHKLEISGVYHLSRNPLYAAFIVFIVPGIAFICNDLLIMALSLAMFAAFKLRIAQEEEFLKKEFGREFQQYAQKVAQLIPFVKV
jgi:protein-S-isoprenylcysteine O-methyltransferase Ste14